MGPLRRANRTARTAVVVGGMAVAAVIGCKSKDPAPKEAVAGDGPVDDGVKAPTETGPSTPQGDGLPPAPKDLLGLGEAETPKPPPKNELEAPVVETEPPKEFWKDPGKHCPTDGRLTGEAGPGKTVRCVDANGRWTGPLARFHKNGALSSLEQQVEGRSHGVALFWFDNGQVSRRLHYRDGSLHGKLQTFDEQGNELSEENYRVGRPWGTFVYRDASGKELSRSELPDGTGTLVKPQPNSRVGGSLSSTYVNGLLHGEVVRTNAEGSIVQRSQWANGQRHGDEQNFDDQGQPRFAGRYKQGKRHGEQRYFEDGQLAKVEHYLDGTMLGVVLYQDGRPLAPAPRYDAKSATAEGLSAVLVAAGADPLPQKRACVQRPQHFAGLVILGSFAHDRGCMGGQYVVDDALVDTLPAPRDILGWSGWDKANAKNRAELALAYVREIDLVWSGTLISDQQRKPDVADRADGGIQIDAWVRRPSGMRRGHREDQLRWVFRADGSLERTSLHSREVDR